MKKFLVVMGCLFASFLHGEEEKVDLKIDATPPQIFVAYLDAFERGDQCMIALSDGSEWAIQNVTKEAFWQSVRDEWIYGDDTRVHFREAKKTPGNFFVKNGRTGSVFFANLDPHSNLQEAVRIVKLDTKGYFLTTSDGNEWCISWIDAWNSYKWRLGDRLFINRGGCQQNGQYIIINADDHNAIKAELIEWKSGF